MMMNWLHVLTSTDKLVHTELRHTVQRPEQHDAVEHLPGRLLVAEEPGRQLPVRVEGHPPLVFAYVGVVHVPLVVTCVVVLEQGVVQHVVDPKDVHARHQVERLAEATHLVLLVLADLVPIEVSLHGLLGEHLERPKEAEVLRTVLDVQLRARRRAQPLEVVAEAGGEEDRIGVSFHRPVMHQILAIFADIVPHLFENLGNQRRRGQLCFLALRFRGGLEDREGVAREDAGLQLLLHEHQLRLGGALQNGHGAEEGGPRHLVGLRRGKRMRRQGLAGLLTAPHRGVAREGDLVARRPAARPRVVLGVALHAGDLAALGIETTPPLERAALRVGLEDPRGPHLLAGPLLPVVGVLVARLARPVADPVARVLGEALHEGAVAALRLSAVRVVRRALRHRLLLWTGSAAGLGRRLPGVPASVLAWGRCALLVELASAAVGVSARAAAAAGGPLEAPPAALREGLRAHALQALGRVEPSRGDPGRAAVDHHGRRDDRCPPQEGADCPGPLPQEFAPHLPRIGQREELV
mmetsp:Transcript_31119/g.87654  ORF Transcript_31119/g.87654 Transcript_31119/m.87654 type:complete len:524 (+) Transcript_31119:175-1746(+)